MTLNFKPQMNTLPAQGIVGSVSYALMQIAQSYYPHITDATVIQVPVILALIVPYVHDVIFSKNGK